MIRTLLAASAMILATPAVAQPAGLRPGLTAVQTTNAIARCIARERQGDAVPVLDLPLGSAEQAAAATRLIASDPKCTAADRGLEFTTLFLVGGMAEELLSTKYSEVSPDVVKLIQPTVDPRTPEEDLALCLSEKWPTETRTIVSTSAGSPGEALAVGKLLPQIGVCVPAGMTMRLNAATVRALAAAALYRVSSQVEAGLLKLGAQ